MKFDLFHNIRFSRYKAHAFSTLHLMAVSEGVEARFTKIADTSNERAALSGVEMDYHQYPHVPLFFGAYDNEPMQTLVITLFHRAWRSNASQVLIPGFDRPEYWSILLATVLLGKKRGNEPQRCRATTTMRLH